MASNLQTWSPSSARRSKPARVMLFRFRNTVALSMRSGASRSATTECGCGELEFNSICKIAIRAGVARKPTSRIACLTNSSDSSLSVTDLSPFDTQLANRPLAGFERDCLNKYIRTTRPLQTYCMCSTLVFSSSLSERLPCGDPISARLRCLILPSCGA